MTIHETRLCGCTPEPLMSYLKALGVLRLVAEQKDKDARGCWRDGVFVLRSVLDEAALLDFFIREYRPTPIVVPWSGSDFFNVDRQGNFGPFKKTPTATAIIEAFLASTTSRLHEYRTAIQCVLDSLNACAIVNKARMEDKKAKSRFMSYFRSVASEKVVQWIDACAVLTDEKASFSALLGSGGGSDGNTHFSDNFMQNLWEVLPDFDAQRDKSKKRSRQKIEEDTGGLSSANALRSALLGDTCTDLIPNRTSALFDGGAVGGQNAGQGFERVSLGNPWSIIFCLEGTLLFAGCVARRHGTTDAVRASFPFQVRLTSTRSDSASDRESVGREFWVPLWSAWASETELMTLLSEGRASVGSFHAERGVDFARAVSSLGIDRGIDSFQRYAIVRGRVGGDNYNTSASLGHFEVRARADVDLIREIDPWLERFRRAASDDTTPPRFKAALRRIESSIFEFCQYGGSQRFTEILCALGRAERELAVGEKFRAEKGIRPLAGLSSEWIHAAFDGSAEFELALALAGIWDPERKIGSMRQNVEPAAAWVDKTGRPGSKWLDKERAVVWNSTDLATNLAAVLGRRLMDAGRKGCESLPIGSGRSASLDAISAFLAGETYGERIEELLFGLLLIDHSKGLPQLPHWQSDDSFVLPRSYALLKLLFLSHPIDIAETQVSVRPELSLLPLLIAGRVSEACAIAARRLRASGLVPMGSCRVGKPASSEEWWTGDIDSQRLAAALLFPVARYDVNKLASLVLRQIKELKNTVQ